MDNLKNFVEFRKIIGNSSFADGFIVGEINPVTTDIIYKINVYDELIDSITDNNDNYILSDDIINHESVKIKLNVMENYYETFEEFIVNNKNSIPEVFYIHELDIYSTTRHNSTDFGKYEDVIAFVNLIRLVSDYCNEDFNIWEFVFLQDEKIIFEVDYQRSDIDSIDLSGMEELHKHFTSESFDTIERIAVFKSELFAILKIIKGQPNTFVELLKCWNDLKEYYGKSYELYIKGFTVEKIRNELEKEKLDISKKIFDVIESLSSKIIVIPIGYYLIISQYDYTGESFSKNLSLIVVSLLFSTLLNILLNNQIKHLDILKGHIVEMSTKYDRIDLLDQVINSLNSVYQNQKNNLLKVKVAVWIIFSLSLMIFIFSLKLFEINHLKIVGLIFKTIQSLI